MEFSAEQIAGILEGEVQGDENVKVSGLSKIEEGQPGTLTFLSNMKYEPHIYNTNASIAIVAKTFEPTKSLPSTLTLVKVEDPYSCFAKLLEVYDQMHQKQPKIEKNATIAESASIGEEVYIGANVYIGENAVIGNKTKIYPNTFIGDNVQVGDETVIHPNASIYHDCVIGKSCLIHAGAVIGSDGFGFAPNEKGEFQKVPQIGNVILEDFVDIGANATIDRATLGSTILRRGVKIDNLVQIAHNVDVGKNSAMAAQAGVAGSTKIGENVLVGGQVGISGHIKIANGTQIVAQSGIPGSVKKPNTRLMGSPAIPMNDYKKSFIGFRRLPLILQRLQDIEEKLK
ncbi:UDP-3-O-(3-hydroxymyristoyl)glucosamine N-acyltransferase [Brumimicrobium aurantiacum]|uniref:UDP-3-O-acylglucosamine N-acyltransferase n=1 Tax=Brumimicrobium aurantiacum TaxID=1737063 RepID=A0A3E1EW82_9FLAO|nr:UDP-3-O-(3-hydroxymyristoyl)glucosamine N-acyltransferase [Brumimicrobium aurantiacum]RFC53824.1 UDP-3-O-(3-hydroxymyristoyl)glucosamine N-acyltransferase [Brumimicrobium aurantiacum]